MEHMKIKEVACQAKVIGTVVTFGGTLLMALYKGPVLSFMRSSTSHASQPENVVTQTGNHWVIGTLFLLIGCAGFSAFYILQVICCTNIFIFLYPQKLIISIISFC